MGKKYTFLSITIILITLLLMGCNKSEDNTNSCINTPSTIYSPLTSNDIINMQKEQELINQQDKEKNNTSDSSVIFPTPYNCSEIEYKIFNLVNSEREKADKSTLKWSDELYTSALTRAKELPQNFSHTRPNGSSCFSLSKLIGGENIAKGYSTADKVLKGWMDSPGHRENILNKSYTKTAIAMYKTNSKDSYYWCQLFAY